MREHPAGVMRARRVAAFATCLLVLTACGGHSSSGASSAPRSTAPPSAGSSPTLNAPQYRAVKVSAATRRASQVAAHAYLAGSLQILASPGTKVERHQAIAGSALQDLLAMRREYAANHYRVVGRPQVVSQKIIKRQTHPTRLVVAACLDNSDVKVLNKKGKRVVRSQGTERVMNLLTLTLTSGRWVVTRTTLPANPSC
jgi:hypothetical protein